MGSLSKSRAEGSSNPHKSWVFSDFSSTEHFDTDIGTEELAHLEIVSTIVHQLTQNLSMDEIEESGFGPYYIDHTIGVWPQAAAGIPLNSCEFQSKGDPITDLFEDLAAEQKARSTYDNILRVVKNMPEVADPIRFLRAREIVHFQRFGEAKRVTSRRPSPLRPASRSPSARPRYGSSL